MKIIDGDSERARLESIARDSWYSKGIAPRTIEYSGKILRRFIQGGNLLELGPAEGIMTALLAEAVDQITVVEGSPEFCRILREKFPRATIVESLFEDYAPQVRFDYIVLGHVLEHVVDPVAILRKAGSWLKDEGLIFAAVPNSRSIHRQAAVLMGLLEREDEMNATDIHHGHRRVYDPQMLCAHFEESGLMVETIGGYWLKPVSNRQIEESWTAEMLDAFMKLGERYPEIAAEIYVVARKRQDTH